MENILNPTLRKVYQRPLNIFEALEKKLREDKDALQKESQEESEKEKQKKYRSEFLFPIQTVF